MGIQIYLTAKGADIAPELWERVYHESLVLLESFPARLTRLDLQELRGEKRYVYTPEIVRNRDTPDEHWRVVGDLSSRQEAEDFELYRHHERQFPDDRSFGDPAESYDVLWAEPDDEFNDFYGNGRLLWDSKTQGCPYHFALLAVGMLVESRCPRAAYVIGDIDLREAREAGAWANTVLEEPIDLPVCVDPDRLYRRLYELYGDERPAFRRFGALYRGESSEVWPAIVRHADASAVRRCLAEGLASFDSLGSAGASEDATGYLEATGDVAGLIETVREIATRGDREPEEFSLERLLEILCADAITIPLEERRVVPVEGLPPLPESETVESLWEMFLRFKSARPAVEVYVPADELLEHFARAEPHRRERFLETIRTSEETAREELSWVAAKVDELERGEASGKSDESTADSPPTGEAYIRSQIAGQTPRYPDEDRLVRQTGAGLREGPLASSAFGELSERDALLRALYRVTRENQIVLTAPSWDAIDALEDEDVLKHLLALALIRERELHFSNWRRYVLEQPRLWDALAGRGTPIP
ncbi:MAG: hypothetical protein ACOC0E_14135 [Spirochaetota bacterium]